MGHAKGIFCVLRITYVSSFYGSARRMLVITVSDIKSRGQPACQEDRKKCKEESVNVVHECDVERMYAVYRVL